MLFVGEKFNVKPRKRGVMQFDVSGYENNRPVRSTYHLSESPVAEAVAIEKECWFEVDRDLDKGSEYGLMTKEGVFEGLFVTPLHSESRRVSLTTLRQTDWRPGETFQVHSVDKIDTVLDYR